MNFEKKTTYTATDINGNEVVLSASAARAIVDAYDRECHKEDILGELESYCKEEGLDVDKISEDTINAIVDEYEDTLGDDDGWSYHADNAIESFADDIRKDCKPQKSKQGRNHSKRDDRG